ncbi:MAG: FIST N-terminal domain-containing protein [Chloroflexota bacterium]
MHIEQNSFTPARGWFPLMPGQSPSLAQLVLVFGTVEHLRETELINTVRQAYPYASLVGCSTAGEIQGNHVLDDSLVVTAITFERTMVRSAAVSLHEMQDSFHAGVRLAAALYQEQLAHVLVFSDGTNVNGSELVRGMLSDLPAHVTVTGGLAADNARFEQTLVWFNDEISDSRIAAIGLYGDDLKVGYGSFGGWDPFGPERLVTRSHENILYELDGQSALALYKKYLGEYAQELPSSGLLFPLSLRHPASERGVVRTILGVNETDQSIIFAGDVPEGAYVRLMKANFDRLIDGASQAAQSSYATVGPVAPELAILISCVGRKLVLKQRVEEEIENVRETLGKQAVFTGFYSNGEIAPFDLNAQSELHNQTMTITTFSERINDM